MMQRDFHQPLFRLHVALAVVSLFAFLVFYFVHGLGLNFSPDSQGYVGWSPLREPLYNGFTFFLEQNDLLEALPFIQVVFLIVSLYLLGLCFYYFSGSYIFSIMVIVLTLLNIEHHKYAGFLLSEGIFFPAFVLLMCSTFLLIIQKNFKNIFLFALSISFLFLIKKLSLVFVILGLIILIFLKANLKSFGLYLAVILVALFASNGIGAYLKEVDPPQETSTKSNTSLLAHSLIGKVAFVQNEKLAHDYPKTTDTFKATLGTAIQVHADMGSMEDRFLFSQFFYDYIRWSNMAKFEESLEADGFEDLSNARVVFSKDAVINNPWGYLKDVYMNFWAGWLIWDLQSHRDAKIFNEKMVALTQQFGWNFELKPINGRSTIVTLGIRTLLYLSFFAGLGFLCHSVYRLIKKQQFDPFAFSLSIIFIYISAYFVIIALFGAGIPRYSFAVWPGHVALIMGAIFYAARYFLPQRLNQMILK